MRKHLTKFEIEQILKITKTGTHAERDHCLIILCFLHGFRVSELCKIQISDIDINGKSIYINRLKNSLSTIQPLIESEIYSINQWLDERRTWNNADSPWLFLSQKGGMLSRQQVYLLFRDYGRKANLSIHLHPHMLRHSCGYALADLGVNTRLIQDYLGHKNIQHTVLYTASNAKRFFGIWDEDQFFNVA